MSAGIRNARRDRGNKVPVEKRREMGAMREIEDEPTWLRFRIRRLRAILRLISQPTTDLALALATLRELIGEAEQRLDDLEKRSQGG